MATSPPFCSVVLGGILGWLAAGAGWRFTATSSRLLGWLMVGFWGVEWLLLCGLR